MSEVQDSPADSNRPRTWAIIYAAVVLLVVMRLFITSRAVTPEKPTPFEFAPAQPARVGAISVYRGSPTHEGVDHSSPLAPPLKLDWWAEVNVGVVGSGTAEPAVDETGVYAGGDAGRVTAFTNAGVERWSYVDGNAGGGVTGAPALDANQIYFGTSAGNLVALAKDTGRVIWMHRFDGAVSGPPVIFDESIFAAVNTGAGRSHLYRVKRATGEVEWRSDEINAGTVSGPAVERTTALAFLGAADRKVHAFSVATGRRAWERELDAEVTAVPMLVGSTLYVASAGEFVYGIDANDGSVIWKTLVLGGTRGTVTWEPATNLAVIGTSRGLIYALDRHSGKVRWIDKTGSIFNGMASALAVSRSRADQSSRLLWVTCADNVVCALDPRGGKIVDQITTLGPVASSPVTFNNALYVIEATGALRKFSSRAR